MLLRDHYNSPQTTGFEAAEAAVGADDVKAAAKRIHSWLVDARSDFPTSHVLFPVGDDNAFLATAHYFDGLDKVIKILRSKPCKPLQIV